MRSYYLYELIDPILQIPKYIGISNNPERRFKEHLEDESNTPKTRWIASLKEEDKIPILKVVKESNSIREIIQLEVESIATYKDKYHLTNFTKGGEYLGIGTPIDVYDLDGNFLESYNSMIEYCELYNIGENYSCISAVCLRKRNYAYNRIFRYSGDLVTSEDLEKLRNSLGKRDPKHIVIFDINGNVLGEFNSVEQASKNGFGSSSALRSALNNDTCCTVYDNLIGSSIEDYPKLIQNYMNRRQRKDNAQWICQYDLNGLFIARYLTVLDAVKALGKSSCTQISKCLKANCGTAYDYQWRYSNYTTDIEPYKKEYHKTINRKRYSPIIQYTLSGEFVREFESGQAAADFLGKCATSIRKAANGQQKQAYGYIWKWKDSAV